MWVRVCRHRTDCSLDPAARPSLAWARGKGSCSLTSTLFFLLRPPGRPKSFHPEERGKEARVQLLHELPDTSSPQELLLSRGCRFPPEHWLAELSPHRHPHVTHGAAHVGERLLCTRHAAPLRAHCEGPGDVGAELHRDAAALQGSASLTTRRFWLKSQAATPSQGTPGEGPKNLRGRALRSPVTPA